MLRFLFCDLKLTIKKFQFLTYKVPCKEYQYILASPMGNCHVMSSLWSFHLPICPSASSQNMYTIMDIMRLPESYLVAKLVSCFCKLVQST